MKIIILSLTITFFLFNYGNVMAESGRDFPLLESELFDPDDFDFKITGVYQIHAALMSRAACLEEYAGITPGTYVCKKENSPEKKYILSEPGISNEAHLCEIDLRFGRNRRPDDWNAKHDFCFCRRILNDELNNTQEEGYSCYKEAEHDLTTEDLTSAEEPDASSEPVEEPSGKLIFPISIDLENHKTITLKNADDEGYKVSIAVAPDSIAAEVKATFDGVISVQTTDRTHIVSLASPTGDEVHYFELHKHTELRFEPGQTVKRDELLALTKHPIIFHVKKNGKMDYLCISLTPVDGSEQTIIIKNKFINNATNCDKSS